LSSGVSFFDDRLSANGTVSCDQWHSPAKGFTNQLPTSMGIHHAFGQRNAPTILNALFNTLQFWDGRAPTLEAQIEGLIVNPVKMGNKSLSDVMAKVKGIPEWQQKFQAVFNGPVTMGDIERAIAPTSVPKLHSMHASTVSWRATRARSRTAPSVDGRCSTAKAAA
jgi:cytochrome c peroxidase